MAGLASYRNADREIEQALIALKKGAQLLKYARKGKPKFCSFRLSSDESSLIWISSRGERSLKLASISRIIPGQRTAVFERYLRPEKDYLSFSLIYNNGKRSLDLICKDKVEAEVWIACLKALIASGQGGRSKIDGWNDGGLYHDESSDLTSNSQSDSSNSSSRDLCSSEVSSNLNQNISPKRFWPDNSGQSERLNVALNHPNMQVKGSGSDAFRVSVSSAPSTASHGSTPDDHDALGDVYIWGEVISVNVVKVGADKSTNYVTLRTDVLLPKPLESNVALDVQHISCGVMHSALVTRQGEVFTWGEESGGRLGHGVGKNVIRPCTVESLAATSVDFVSCGEFHTCAVTMAGELYTWGDGTHYAGLLGHGSDVSHWIPKRVSGALEGLQIASVACGPWHTALITSMGQLFTFGVGTFGVLGHGDRESVSYPREVESLSGLRTIAVACGVWHTAAVVEVIVTQSSSSVSSGKLFTWGDGDKNRLGHGDKDPRLKPTCVPSLIDYNFHKISCGHSLTIGLTTSGQVFTMGSPVYGQLGNPSADGKLPCLVEDKLAGESIEEVACGAYHVAVLTCRNEVYTWGKGANGRLGHGDVEDRKIPTLVECLKDKHVKYISCGSNYMAAICLHKWVSSAEESQCSACRQTFGFTRKRHNCYNCGIVHCHSCSSRRAVRAALAPNPAKPYRVCDSCYSKLNNGSEVSNHSRKNAIPRLSGAKKDRLEKNELKVADSMPSNLDLIKQLDSKAAKQGRKPDTYSLVRSSQEPFLVQHKDVVLPMAVDLPRMAPKPILTAHGVKRFVSPLSKRSPPRSATPVPTASGLSFSKSVSDSLKRTNELLNHEVSRLRAQVESMSQRYELQELELQRSMKKAQEAHALVADESAKSQAAKEVIKSLTTQLKDMAERFPAGVNQTEDVRPVHPPNGLEQNGIHYLETNGKRYSRSDSISSFAIDSPSAIDTDAWQGSQGLATSPRDSSDINLEQEQKLLPSNGIEGRKDFRLPDGSSIQEELDGHSEPTSNNENSLKSRNSTFAINGSQVEAEWIEQFEPGVYITLVVLQDGARDIKRVRFREGSILLINAVTAYSRRRFEEHQAENWWAENRERVYEKYNVCGADKSSILSQARGRSEGGAVSPSFLQP